MKKIYPLIVAAGIFTPAITFASVTDFRTLVNALIQTVNLLVPLMIGVAVIVFIVGVIRSIAQSSSEKGRTEGKNLLIFGVIAFTVVICLWGIVNLFKNTLFGDSANPIPFGTTTNTPGQDYYPPSQVPGVPDPNNPTDPNAPGTA